MKNKELLFVQPNFPTPRKSINHANFLPIGLLKLITYYRNLDYYIDDTQLVRGEISDLDFVPSKIFITSLFTYWFEQVRTSIVFYRKRYPDAEIHVGGILATLMPEKVMEVDDSIILHKGIDYDIESLAYKLGAAYDVVDKYGVDYQIVHAMRGCIRQCEFCGTWRLEERKDYDVNEVIDYIRRCATSSSIEKRRIIFYDNNFLAHSRIEELLKNLAEIRINGNPITCESQSGFDGRILLEKPHLARLIKSARFQRPKIAWDNSLDDIPKIEKQIEILESAGYKRKDISVFMIYNWDYPFELMLQKVKKCWQWKVQISDCRYRPLTSTFDNYDPQRGKQGQSNEDYHIHTEAGWSDSLVRLFRKIVRQQNIMVRQGWGPIQFEQWSNHQLIDKDDDGSRVWPDYLVERASNPASK